MTLTLCVPGKIIYNIIFFYEVISHQSVGPRHPLGLDGMMNTIPLPVMHRWYFMEGDVPSPSMTTPLLPLTTILCENK